MDAVKFIEEQNRMCNSFSPDCEGCRVDEAKPVMDECCRWMFENPERAVKIVEEWAAAHPRKTRQSVFLKQWPNARPADDGVLTFCPKRFDFHISCLADCHSLKKCSNCRRNFWLQEVE